MPNKITKFLEGRDKHFVEEGANLEHERWSKWQKYLHSRGIPDGQGEGYLCLPMGLVKHWNRQIATPYSELSEQEKESDREQVRPYLPMINQTSKELIELIIEMVEENRRYVSNWDDLFEGKDSCTEQAKAIYTNGHSRALKDIKQTLQEALDNIR